MKKLFLVVMAVAFLAGCQGRTLWNPEGELEDATDREIWDDNGEIEEATSNREIWNSKGKMDTGGRKIWHDADGNPVIQ